MNIDLHTHSYFSDGELSPEDVIAHAASKNISILSITDHNFLLETEPINEYATKNHLVLIEGIEISTLLRLSNSTDSLHILGYGKKLNKDLLSRQLMKTVDGYNHRARAIVDKLNREFPALKLDFESLKVSGREVAVSRNTLARLLVAHLQNSISIKDVLKKHVFVKEDDSWMMSPEESFKLITDAGGIPILAHSGRELRRLGPVNYEHMIARLVESGLSGLEVHYPKHTVEEIKIMKNIAYQYNLYTTGGSDWHGNMYTPDSELGREFSEEDVIPFLNDKKITAIA